LVIKPKFWGDALWFYPALMLVFGAGFGIMMWRLAAGKPEWIGLTVIMNFLIQPIFFLLWIDNLSNRAVFEEKQVVLKGFLHRKKIEYANIRGIFFSELENVSLAYFNPGRNRNECLRMFIWNRSINALIDEVKKRTSIKVDGYPDKVNRRNFQAKVWFLAIMFLTVAFFDVIFWQPPELKSQYQNIQNNQDQNN